MGATASVTNNNTTSNYITSLSRSDYITAIVNLESSTIELNVNLIDIWGKIDQLDIRHSLSPAHYIRVVSEMEAVLVTYQMRNMILLETVKDRHVEHYWAKYIKNCKKTCETITHLQSRIQDIDQRLADYMIQSKHYKTTCPNDKTEYNRLVNIQKQINRDAIWLRGDKQHFHKCFNVVTINLSRIDVRASSMLKDSPIYWGSINEPVTV